MKKLLLTLSCFTAFSAPAAFADWQTDRAIRELESRIFRLERTVQQLQFEVDRLRGTPQPNPRNYFCEVRAFAKVFSAFGPTEVEAKSSAVEQCTREYHAMHCENVKCQINQ